MKISLIAPSYLPARRANTIQTMKMAQAMTQAGHRVEVAVPAAPGQATQVPWGELADQYGLSTAFDIRWLPVEPRWRRYDYGWSALGRARQFGADLIFTRLPQAAWLASRRGPAVIYELHDLPQGRLGRGLFQSMLTGPQLSSLVVITQALKTALAATYDLGSVATLVEPDGVDLERYAELPAPAAARADLGAAFDLPERFTAGYSGHLYAGRGAELLLHLAQRLPEINVLIIGGEPGDVARVKRQAELIGLENVQLTGFVPSASLPRYQAACEALLMPYQRQVAASSGGDIGRYLSPMKLFEYLACGRVILSSDLPVLREVLNEGNAILLPPEDVDAWEAALAEVAAESAKFNQLGTNALEAAQHYAWQARAERLLEGL